MLLSVVSGIARRLSVCLRLALTLARKAAAPATFGLLVAWLAVFALQAGQGQTTGGIRPDSTPIHPTGPYDPPNQLTASPADGTVFYFPTSQSFPLNFTDLAGNAPTYASNTPSVCTASATTDQAGTYWTVQLVETGTCTIKAKAEASPGYVADSETVSYPIEPSPERVFTVTTLADDVGNAANCTNQAASRATPDASCSLRDAVLAAKAACTSLGGPTCAAFVPTVNFSNTLRVKGAPLSRSNPGAYRLRHGPLVFSGVVALRSEVKVVGPGEDTLRIDGGGQSTVIDLAEFADVSISGLTISGGNGSTGGGFEVKAYSGSTIDHCIITGNSATRGGGIYMDSGSLEPAGALTVTNTTVSGNTATNSGGGLWLSLSATATLDYVTVSGNTVASGGFGAGIYSHGIGEAGANLYMKNSTVSGNSIQGIGGSSTPGAGIYTMSQVGDLLAMTNSIVSGNWIGQHPLGRGYDDLDDASGSTVYTAIYGSETGNVIGAYNTSRAIPPSPAIQLAPLGYYGGLTKTMIPLPGSPAICAGLVKKMPAGATADQRGLPATNNTYGNYSGDTPCVDAGAVQTNYALSFTSANSLEPIPYVAVSTAITPAPAVTLLESGWPFADGSDAIQVPLALNPHSLSPLQLDSTADAELSGNSALTVYAPNSQSAGVATYPALKVSTPGAADTLAAYLILNPSLPVDERPTTAAPSLSFAVQSGAITTTTVPMLSTVYSPSAQALNVSATVTAAAGTVQGGNVLFALENTSFDFVGSAVTSGTVTNGAAGASYTLPAGTLPGLYYLYGTYSGVNGSFVGGVGGSIFTVRKAPQSIASFTSLPSAVTYGVPPMQLAATATSGLAVSFSVVSGPARISGPSRTMLQITGAGRVVVAASQSGNAVYLAAPPVTQAITVNKATLLAAAIDQSFVYGEPVPHLTYTLTGFVNQDTAATAVHGQPALSTTARSTSTPGSYPIQIEAGTLTAANYAFTFRKGVMTVLPRGTVALPSIKPGTGAYAGAQTVSITDSSHGSAIYYTTDGSTPTAASHRYTAPFRVTKTTTVKAIAELAGYTNSDVAVSVITIH